MDLVLGGIREVLFSSNISIYVRGGPGALLVKNNI